MFGRLPLSHLVGLSGLTMLTPLAHLTDPQMLSGLATLLLIVAAAWGAWPGAERPDDSKRVVPIDTSGLYPPNREPSILCPHP